MKTILLLFLTFSMMGFAQDKPFKKEEIKVNSLINGTLYSPERLTKSTDLVIIIAGSGAPDRDGNQKGMNNNSLRYLAEKLSQNDIAAFSFDKRTIALIASGNISEKDLSFEDFITDVKDIITFFKSKKQYRHIIIVGHSEGSLIGMIAANGNADGCISIAGAGRSIDLVIAEQIGKQAPNLKEEVEQDLAVLKSGQTFELKNQSLGVLFRESVQPYMISWIKYNPIIEIQKLKIPVLLINGTKDIQVPVSDAELLKKAKPEAQLAIITNMNHLFKEIKTDDLSENQASYNNPDLPVMPELVTAVNQFIKSL
ncbi:serine aminopeptidase domain-containing protein [Flavobacterium sp.]|uniref:alpha/beta hydrolase n=1 Tax=Flavobacterium sp. TaxID=239 RepID=UPI00286CF511|nr:alpha/beta hydrolase [Flavobacterium sp.]